MLPPNGLPRLLSAFALTGLAVATAPAAAADDPGAALARRAAQAALSRGDAALARGDLDSAVPALTAAAQGLPEVGDLAYLLLARAHLAAGRPEEALRACGSAASAVRDSVRSADVLWVTASAHLAAGRPGEAASVYATLRRSHGEDARADRAAVEEALALEAAGSPSAAEALRRVALRQPSLAPPDALDRARASAERAGRRFVAPTGTELLERADRLRSVGDHAAAEAAYAAAARALDGADGTDTALIRRARSLHRLRRDDEARATCLELVRRFPATRYRTAALHVRARAAWRHDQGEELLAVTGEAADQARHRSSSWRDDLLLVRAGYLMEKSRWDEAVRWFDRLADEYPSGPLLDDARWKAAWCRLLQGRPDSAAARFERLSATASDRTLVRAGALWEAVCLRRAGDDAGCLERLRRLSAAHPFTYHGVRARELLGAWGGAALAAAASAELEQAGVPFVHPGPPSLPPPHGPRYALLRECGLTRHALPELEAVRRQVADSDALVFELATARSQAGQASAAQRLLAGRFWEPLQHPSRRSPPEFWRIVYPQPHGDAVRREAARTGVPAALISAVIRTESWWAPDVRSAADARGLMQLIPPTARRMAAAEGLAGFSLDDLWDPAVNVRLGARYLKDLLALHEGDVAAAVASYNAGEEKVSGWWRSFDAEGVELEAERVARIPYRETRRYVRKVLEALAWYDWLGRGGGSPDDLASGAGS